jgi:hypothetical protein
MERAAAAFLIVFPGVATLPGTGRADSTAVTQATTAVPNSPANAPDPPPAGLLAPIAVIAKRPPIAELTPLQHISANEIRVSGASNLADLLQTLAPQLGANVDVGSLNLLLNGRPTAGGLLELQDIPPEAIQSIDLLPPEAALQFGYSPDKGPVVNFGLYPRFVATTAEATASVLTDNGEGAGQVDATHTRIEKNLRTTFGIKASEQEAVKDTDPLRTLAPQTRGVQLHGVVSWPVGARFNGTLNAAFRTSSNQDLLGAPVASVTLPSTGGRLDREIAGFGALHQQIDSWKGVLSGGLNGIRGPLAISLRGSYSHAVSKTQSDAGLDASALQAGINAGAIDPFAPWQPNLLVRAPQNEALSRRDTIDGVLNLGWPMFKTPAGSAAATFTTAASSVLTRSDIHLSARSQTFDRTLSTVSAQAGLTVPLTARSREGEAWLRGLSVGGTASVTARSDRGGLLSVGGRLNWLPSPYLIVRLNAARDEIAPTVEQLTDPMLVTESVPVFDYVTGRTVDARVVQGGSAILASETRKRFTIDINSLPFKNIPSLQSLLLNFNYLREDRDNPIMDFPTAAAGLQAAFPGRLTRSLTGDLVQADYRPVNFYRGKREQIQWGFSFSRSLGPPIALKFVDETNPAEVAAFMADMALSKRVAAPGAQISPNPDNFIRFGSYPRLSVSLNHLYVIRDEAEPIRGAPVMDRLHGAAGLDGGVPRNQILLAANYSQGIYGGRVDMKWKEGTTVLAGPGQTSDLQFSATAQLNLKLYMMFDFDPHLVDRHNVAQGQPPCPQPRQCS